MDGSNQWYMAIGGHQVGPVSQDEIITNLQNGTIDGETLVFTAGMTNVADAEGRARLRGLRQAPRPLRRAGPRRGHAAAGAGRRAHEIDYEILGDDMQFVEVELDPGEAAVAEAGGDDVHDDGHRDGDDLRRRQPAAVAAASWARCSAPASACSPASPCS